MPEVAVILVVDANIWIDFHHAGRLKDIFALPFEICTTDFIAAELKNPDITKLKSLGLRVESLSAEKVELLFKLANKYRKPSLPDLSCLLLAKDKNCGLLTGDNNLRAASKEEGVKVHGTLWLLDKLVEHKVLKKKSACEALEKMIEQGTRLPVNESAARIKNWKY